MKLVKLSESVYFSEVDSSFTTSILGYIHGNRFSIMIGAGHSKQHISKFYRSLRNYHLPYPKYCIIPHWVQPNGLHAVPCDQIAHVANEGSESNLTFLVEHSLKLNCGGITCRCVAYNRNLLVYVEEERVVFLGSEKLNDALYEVLSKLEFEVAVFETGKLIFKSEIV